MIYLRQVLPVSRRVAQRLQVLLRVAVVDDQRVPHLIVTFFVVGVLLPLLKNREIASFLHVVAEPIVASIVFADADRQMS